MKTLLAALSLFTLTAFQVGCDRRIPQEEIQREEALGVDDIRETGPRYRSRQLEQEEQILMDRGVSGDDAEIVD